MASPRICMRPALIGAILIFALPARAAILSHLSGDAALAALSPTFSFAAEGRIGDLGGAATFELDLGHDTAAPATTAQYNWVSGQVEPFTLTGDAILSWTGAAPTQSNLAFQIKVAALPTTPVRAVTWGGVKQTYR